MSRHKIQRTGQAALVFEGAQLAEASGLRHGGRDCNRWYDLAVYRTDSGRIVVTASYETRWEGEDSQHVAEVVEDVGQVADALAALKVDLDSRTAHYGYPVGMGYGEKFEAKQARLRSDLRTVWDSRVSAILDEIGAVEAL